MKLVVAVAAIAFTAIPALAQDRPHPHGHHGPAQNTPYAGLQQRAVKALSEQQIADLKAGRGMGFALAAELNGYPGPLHVLELAEPLHLDAGQRQRVQQMFDAMKSEAVAVGERLIAEETELDRAFAGRSISPTALDALTARIARIQGELRAVHLKYHLIVADLLTEHQKHRYSQLRGYRQ
jgi:hypothetical protein